jgi:hypothetical protein
VIPAGDTCAEIRAQSPFLEQLPVDLVVTPQSRGVGAAARMASSQRNIMKNMQKLLVTTAVLALAAGPLAAVTLDTNATLGSYDLIYPQVDPTDSTGPATGDAANSVAGEGGTAEAPDDPDDSTGPATGDGAASASGTSADAVAVTEPDPDDSVGPATGDDGEQVQIARPPLAPGLQIDAASGFVGNSVLSSDGVLIGVVEEVVTQADGSKLLVILRNGGTTSESRFTISIDGAAVPDGQVDLGWTEAELSAAVSGL